MFSRTFCSRTFWIHLSTKAAWQGLLVQRRLFVESQPRSQTESSAFTLVCACSYTFKYGPVFFIQFSTEIDFGEGSPQHDFILQALKAVNRTVFPWLVVGFHRPYLEPSVSLLPAAPVSSPFH